MNNPAERELSPLLSPAQPEYTVHGLNKGDSFMPAFYFYSVIAFILMGILIAGYYSTTLIVNMPELVLLFCYQFLNLLNGLYIMGLGLGLPLIVIGSILGWGQFALLLQGKLNPHVEKEGFISVIKLLYSKI